LVLDYPGDLEMRVSHETIYQSLLALRRGVGDERARHALFEYLKPFYNERRRHSALGYPSPRAFERQWQHETLAS
jgi:putative transposase